ncbi:SDR family NAD(P)-dependent oxidoreductase [Hyphobacterium sp.]|uniref:SDR family NAD(P)-dependent oxidoreductase n=1 Tax=Hyphobacterium sp. TaxID=2004662 RepID=UPI003BABC348
MTHKPVALVAGAGPGLGQYLLRFLSEHGYNAFGFNRSVRANFHQTVVVDLADERRVKAAVRDIHCAAGVPRLVIHNPASLLIAPFAETSPGEFEKVWRSMVLSAVHVARATLPTMAEMGGGTFVATGATASLRGGKNFSAFASAKSALRTLMQSLAKEYGPQGVHVAHVVLDGILDTRASRKLHGLEVERVLQLKDVALAYLYIATQPRSAWSFETDLRPMGENF